MKGLYYNVHFPHNLCGLTFILCLNILFKDHFSLAALFQFWSSASSFHINHFIKKKKRWKKVNIILTDCTINRASSSLQQNGLPLTRTFVLENKIKNMFYQSVEKSHTQLSTYGEKKNTHLHIQSSEICTCKK